MQYKKMLLLVGVLAVVGGSLGGLVMNRYFIPFLSSIDGLGFFSDLKSDAPIIINRKEEIHYNDGANTIELAKEASKFVYDIYTSQGRDKKLAGLGLALTNDGLIAVSKDSIDKADEIFAVSSQGNVFKAEVKAMDNRSKLAFVSIAINNNSIPSFSEAFQLKAGQKIIVMSQLNKFSERGFSSAYLTQSLSLKNPANGSFYSDALEERLSIFPELLATESLGAPLINLEGRVVGLILGADFVLPVEYLQQSLRSYLQHQKIIQPYLGIRYSVFNNFQAEIYDLAKAGVLINSVEKNSAAESAGLKAGDVIVKIDDKELKDSSFERLINTSDQDRFIFSIIRGSAELNLEIKPIKK